MRRFKNYWIEPNGTKHHVGYFQHEAYASNYLQKLFETETEKDWLDDNTEYRQWLESNGYGNDYDYASDRLEAKGWVRLVHWDIDQKPTVCKQVQLTGYDDIARNVTSHQLVTLKSILGSNL